MKTMKIYIFIVAILYSFSSFGQEIRGIVSNDAGEPLIGANIFWEDIDLGASADELGKYSIPYKSQGGRLIVSYIGFASDTIDVGDEDIVNFVLTESLSIDGVVVKAQRDGIIISNLNPIKTEQITETELKKAACCDLAGCFGTQTTVQPHTTNVITNSKELRILGLSGVYNQVLINGLPMIQGLSYTYGISSFPGTVVDNIFISKGANSVLQGYESISGQINVLTKNGDDAEKLFLNMYINSFQEKHINANVAFQKNDWSSLTAFHTVQPAKRVDRDNDNFLDVPLLTRYSVSNTWKYRSAGDWGWNSEIGARFVNEDRQGGQKQFDRDEHLGGTEFYGQTIKLNQPEIWTKTGFRFDDTHNITFSASSFYQKQESYFGTVKYDAEQFNFFGKFIYELNYLDHNLKVGTSLRYLDLQEDIAFTENILNRSYDGEYRRKEIIPGILVENTMRFLDDRLTWILGVRGDRHNQFGSFFTPRTLLKYDISPLTVVRGNIGTGWRTANVFSENVNLLASSRDIIIQESLLPEQAINMGVNLIQKFDSRFASGYFSADFYRTEFQNQIFPDFDIDPRKAVLSNYQGKSIGNGFQAEMNLKFMDRFEVKSGYNYLDVYRLRDDAKELLPFNSKHRVLGVVSYRPLSNKYFIDINANWFGKQRLPNTSLNPSEFRRPTFSEAYTLVNTQFTYRFPRLEIYAGCENIFDFRQLQPIVSWQDPFSPYFDTNSVWGPTRGREFYIGFRYKMFEKE